MAAKHSFEPVFEQIDPDLHPSDQPEFLSDEEEQLFHLARKAVETREFLRSTVGQYIKNCAAQEIRDAQKALLTVLPWRRRKIQAIQNRAQSARFVIEWINEILTVGDFAEQRLKQGRSED